MKTTPGTINDTLFSVCLPENENFHPFIDILGDETTHTVSEREQEFRFTNNIGTEFYGLRCTCSDHLRWCSHRAFVVENHLDSNLLAADRVLVPLPLFRHPLTDDAFGAVFIGREHADGGRSVYLTTRYEPLIIADAKTHTHDDRSSLFLGTLYKGEGRAVMRDLIHEFAKGLWREIKCQSLAHTPTSAFGSAFRNALPTDPQIFIEGLRIITGNGICSHCRQFSDPTSDIPDL